jgi:hypothetical protein
MKTVSVHEDPARALDQFEHLACRQQGTLGRGLARIAMLLAVGRYCRYRHLPIGHQATFQRKLMDQESHHEY